MSICKILILGILSFTFLTGCALSTNTSPEKNPLIGTWKTADYYLVFDEDNSLKAFDKNKKSINVEHEGPIKYEMFNKVTPHQLYFTIVVNGKEQRVLVGIYKIDNGKLIIGKAIERRKEEGLVADHADGTAPELSELEAPSDFSGEIIVFDKIED